MKSSAQQRPAAPPARIHLRVKHPKLDPNEITRILSMTPEHTLDAGRRAASMTVDSYWIAPLAFSSVEEPWVGLDHRDSHDTALHVVSAMQMMADETVVGLALRRLQPHQSFFQTVADEGGTATLLVNVDKAGSMTIPPSLARKLADMGLGLELDWSDSVE